METLPVMATGQLPRGLSSPLADRVMDAHVAGAPQSTKYPAVGVPSATDTRAQDTRAATFISPHQSSSQPTTVVDVVIASLPRIEATNTPSGIVSSQHSPASPPSSGPPRLAATSSNVSAHTDPETRQTSPVSSINRELVRDGMRPITPRSDARAGSRMGSANTSPMSLVTSDAVLVQGTKRTASGACKTTMPESNAVTDNMQSRSVHTRHQSLDSRVGKVGNLTAQLKTRLSYAMVKVQNGWEKRSIDEIEENLSRNASPMVTSPKCANAFDGRYSPVIESRSAHSRATGSGGRLVEGSSSGMNVHDRRNNGDDFTSHDDTTPKSYEPLPSHVLLTRALNTHPSDSSSPTLAPSPSLVTRRSSKRQQSSSTITASTIPPRIATNNSSNATMASNGTAATPSTPLHGTNVFSQSYLSPVSQHQYHAHSPHRPSVLRMPSHQAEKDAIDTLVLLRSPHSATFAKHDHGSTYGQSHDRMGSVGGSVGMAGSGVGVGGASTSSALSTPMVVGLAGHSEGEGIAGVRAQFSP